MDVDRLLERSISTGLLIEVLRAENYLFDVVVTLGPCQTESLLQLSIDPVWKRISALLDLFFDDCGCCRSVGVGD